MKTALLLFAGLLQEEARIDDVDYDRHLAPHVRSLEALERSWREKPAAALVAVEALIADLERDVAPRFSSCLEAQIVVRATRGIDKGQVKERHACFPYRLAGEIAMGADEPGKAAAFLKKSPSSRKLLEAALAAAEKRRPPPLQKPALDLSPFLPKGDFIGALEALRVRRADLADDFEKRAEELRQACLRRQREATSRLAAVLPRLEAAEFRKEHLEPCLAARVPPDWEIEEWRWARRLDRWAESRTKPELEKLAIEALKFAETDFHVLCEQAQKDRLSEAGALVEEIRRAGREARAPLLDRMGGVERALQDLLAARPQPAISKSLAELKARLPVDEEALDRARKGAEGIDEIRRLADALERLWSTGRREQLSIPDQKDLALYLGIYRCYALFLEGRTIEETAKDARVAEVLRGAGELPAGLSPKVAAVRARLK